MGKNNRKKAEIGIIREFLKFMGCKVLRVTSNENPDAFVIVEEAGKRKKIGVEHTEYHLDALHGKASPGKRIYGFWRLVQSSIRRRVSHRPKIQHMTGVVFLKEDKKHSLPDPKTLKAENLAKDLAGELVELALDSNLPPNGEQTIRKFSDEHPLLGDYVRKVELAGTGLARCVSWECADAIVSSIGVSAKEIAIIIRNKAKKFPKYKWDDVNERWLLISASGSTVFNLAGVRPEHVDWGLTEIRDACSSAGVDRIFFWDRRFNWYKEVWPGGRLVKREWRAKKSLE